MGIHGDKSQQERDWVLNGTLTSPANTCHISAAHVLKLFIFLEFKYGKAPILIATDVASRGLGQYPS